jgi:hypothetical protein
MSRNNKNARNLERARTFSKARQNGEKGPSRTTPVHGKRWTYRKNPDVLKRLAELAKQGELPAKTSGREFLEGAGKAAQQNDQEVS